MIEGAFKRIDAFGLRVEILEKDQETQLVYTATLSAFRFKVHQTTLAENRLKTISKEQEFSNSTPHYMRSTLMNDLKQNLKAN